MKTTPFIIEDSVSFDTLPSDHSISDIDWRIIQVIAYFDLFDYPLTAKEIHRYLPSLPVSYRQILEALTSSRLISNLICSTNGYYTFADHSFLVDIRLEKSKLAQEKWSQLLKYTRILSLIPFVRMVAVTGTLAMDIATLNSDIDLFVVAERNKVWTCRAFFVILVYLLKLFDIHLCPNYVISEQHIIFEDRNMYVAHEITQMIPLLGLETYWSLRRTNSWTNQFLPNAAGPPDPPVDFYHLRNSILFETVVRASAQLLLCNKFGDALERWERTRKINKLNRINLKTNETLFTPDVCKGHFGQHMELTLKKYQSKLCELEALVLNE